PRERGDDLFDHAISEVFLLGITGQVLEQKNRDGRFVRERRGRAQPVAQPAMRSHAYSKSADRLGDVLELFLAPILEANVQLALDLAMDFAGDEDTARIGNAFKPGRDVDPVAINIALLVNNHIPQIDPYPQLKGALVRREVILNFQPALYRSQRAGKFR